MKINKQKGGILKWLILIVVIIIIMSFFFGFSIQEMIENEQTQSNFNYISEQLHVVYDTYLSDKVNVLIDLAKSQLNNLGLDIGDITGINQAD